MFRKILFWTHLVSGLIAGLVIAVMSITGVALAFEKQIVDWADRPARQFTPPAAGTPKLPLEELIARARQARPDAKPSGVTVFSDPGESVLVSTGRGEGVYVNPHTGEVKDLGAQGWRAFFHTMTQWHRWLAASGDHRAIGKAVTGVSNVAFLLLALTGLYLWWPRRWIKSVLRRSIWFRGGLRGKARDWNWHNTIGFWMLPVLIVLTTSAMVISFKWASDLVYQLAGEQPQRGRGGTPPPEVAPPGPEVMPQSLDALFAAAQQQKPTWQSVMIRLAEREPAGSTKATTLTVRTTDRWPLFASDQVSVNPFTAEVVRTEGFADYTTGRKARSWLRFLHTGEALGWLGQLVAMLASLGGAFLVYTGFALAWRRFFPEPFRWLASLEAPRSPVAAPHRGKSSRR